MNQGSQVGEVAQFTPMILLAIPFAIGFYHLAGRMGRSQIGWFVLSLIPVINFFFFVYGWFVTVLYVLDRLNRISGIKPRSAELLHDTLPSGVVMGGGEAAT